MNDRIPPHDIKSEEALLGSLLIDPGIIDNVMAALRPDHFYHQVHQLIYEAMREVYDTGVGIDYITVTNALKKRNRLDAVGGVTVLTNLTRDVSTGYNYGYHTLVVIENYVRRQYISTCMEAIEQGYDQTNDISDMMSFVSTELIRIQEVFGGINRSQKLRDLADQSVEQYFERKKLYQEGGTIGITGGLKKLNRVTGGWQRGDSILLAGRTSMGKTAMSLHFAMSAAISGKRVQFFSFEMTAARLADRIMIATSMVSPDAFKYGNLLQEDEAELERTVDKLKGIGLYIDDNCSQTIDQVFAKCRIAQKKGECDLIIIDYVGLVPPIEKKAIREQEVSDISKRIKKYAKELDVPVITLVQVNRSLESAANKRPRLSDLRESGALEQDADVVLFVYRPEYYGINTITVQREHGPEEIDSAGKGIIIVAKQRNGQTGDILFEHSHGLNVIKDLSDAMPF